MQKFVISWPLNSEERLFDENTRRGFWTLELNAEWKMKCICEQNKQRNPDFLEVHRKSPVGEIIISGTLEIYEEKQLCLPKKFICLFEDRCLFTRIDIKYPRKASIPPCKTYFIIGEITTSARTEASFNLTQLVHMTDTDYSSLRHLSNDMEKLLLKSHLTDMNLKCGAVSIPVHKCILSARSPVFEAMLSCPMKEATENEIIIEDIEEPVLQAMVKYMYTGKTEDLTPSLATALLFAANKYQISCLEFACSKYLMRNMSMKNVAIVLGIGDLVSKDLKNFAIDFVCNKCTDYSALEKRKDWIDLKSNNPSLALEIFSAIVKFQERKLKSASKISSPSKTSN